MIKLAHPATLSEVGYILDVLSDPERAKRWLADLQQLIDQKAVSDIERAEMRRWQKALDKREDELDAREKSLKRETEKFNEQRKASFEEKAKIERALADREQRSASRLSDAQQTMREAKQLMAKANERLAEADSRIAAADDAGAQYKRKFAKLAELAGLEAES